MFSSDRPIPASAADGIGVRLSEFVLKRPRQWGACWLFNQLWEELGLREFWGDKLGEEPRGKLWELYMQLCHVEEAFRDLKGDLGLRPIYHQREARIEAHIFVAFLAYCIQVTLRHRLRLHAPGLTPRAVIEKLATIQMLDAWFPMISCRVASDYGTSIGNRCEDGIKNFIKSLGQVLREKTQNKDPVLLQQSIFPAISSVCVLVVEVVGVIQFDSETERRTIKINLHHAVAVEWNREAGIEFKAIRGFRERLKAAVKKGFAGAPCAGDPLGIWHILAGGMEEEVR